MIERAPITFASADGTAAAEPNERIHRIPGISMSEIASKRGTVASTHASA